MPLIFVGGARGTGKTTLIKALKKRYAQVEHVGLAQEVNQITSAVMFQDQYVGMRRLTPDQQHKAASEVLKKLAHKSQEDPSRIIFIDGHYVSSSYVDNHESFIPYLGQNARFFEKMIWVKIEPHQILYRRFKRERLARPFDLTVREYLAEGLEAKLLERRYGTQLLKCTDEDFFDVVYTHLGRYLHRSDLLPARFKVEAVLRLLHGDQPDRISQELGITVETLSRWLHRFIAAGSAEFETQNPRDRAREIVRLKTLIAEMVREAETPRDGQILPDSSRPSAAKRWV